MSSGGVPFSDLALQHTLLSDELEAAYRRVLETSQFILGEEVLAFESAFATYCGTQEAVGCGNGTDALELALAALGIGEEDEVITVSHTFAATVEAIIRVGARPRLVDVYPDSLLMDIDAVQAAITPRTRAIIPVHLYGSVADVTALLDLATPLGIHIIEDAAQAHGASRGKVRPGMLGAAATFSFYPGKNLGAIGDAGAVICNDPFVAERLRLLRDHGRTSKYSHITVGRNSRMDGLQGAVLRIKLERLSAWNARRRQIAQYYTAALLEIPEVEVVSQDPIGSVFHLYVVRVKGREDWASLLKANGIASGVHYPVPVHLQPAFQKYITANERLEVTEAARSEVLSLPIFPEMTDGQVDRVVEGMRLVAAMSRPLSDSSEPSHLVPDGG